MTAEALQLTADFSIDALEYTQVDIPEPAADEVLVRVRAVSLNYRDLMVVRGHYNPHVQKPLTLCSDCSGDVAAVGKDVTAFAPGDRVMASFFLDWQSGPVTDAVPPSALGEAQQGVLTTYRVFPARALVAVPASLSHEEASCLPCAGVTAWNALTQIVPANEQSTVLLQGTGGVSIFGLQIAHALGARTVITSSSDAKLQQARELGASDTINYRERPEWDREVRNVTQKHGVTHVLEVGGAGTFPLSLRSASRSALIAVIGILSGTEQPINLLPVLMNTLRVQGVYVGSTTMLHELATFLHRHGIHPIVDRTFSFQNAQDAFRHLESGSHFGKVVITV